MVSGCTRHFAAYTLCMMVNYGWATQLQLKRAIVQHSYAQCGEHMSSTPGYLPSGLFTRTKVYTTSQTGKGAPFIWGPHKEAKLPYTAHATLFFTIHSMELLRPFVPKTDDELPAWWLVWKYHVAAVTALTRFHFTYADLLAIEELNVLEDTNFYAAPEYADCWIPKVPCL